MYSFVELLTNGPVLIYYMVRIIFITAQIGYIANYAHLFMGLAGFINCVVYFFQRTNSFSGKKISIERLESVLSSSSDLSAKSSFESEFSSRSYGRMSTVV